MVLLWIKVDEVQHIYSILHDDDNIIEDGVQHLNIRCLSMRISAHPLMDVLSSYSPISWVPFLKGTLGSRNISTDHGALLHASTRCISTVGIHQSCCASAPIWQLLLAFRFIFIIEKCQLVMLRTWLMHLLSKNIGPPTSKASPSITSGRIKSLSFDTPHSKIKPTLKVG